MGDKKYVKLKPAKICERTTSDPVADQERPLRRIRYPLLSSHSHGKNGRYNFPWLPLTARSRPDDVHGNQERPE